MFIIIPMSFINNIRSFYKVSVVSSSFIIICLCVIFFYFIKEIINGDGSRFTSNMANFKNLPIIIGITILSYGPIGLTLMIRNSV